MAEQSFKGFYWKFVAVFLLATAGFYFSKDMFSPKSPVFVTYGGHSIHLDEIEAGMSETERTGNSPEYKKQIALNMIRTRLIRQLAAKENLSEAEYFQKIKAGAETTVTDEEYARFIKERGIRNPTPAQAENIRANMKERKREIFFGQHIEKILADSKVQWAMESPAPDP